MQSARRPWEGGFRRQRPGKGSIGSIRLIESEGLKSWQATPRDLEEDKSWNVDWGIRCIGLATYNQNDGRMMGIWSRWSQPIKPLNHHVVGFCNKSGGGGGRRTDDRGRMTEDGWRRTEARLRSVRGPTGRTLSHHTSGFSTCNPSGSSKTKCRVFSVARMCPLARHWAASKVSSQDRVRWIDLR